MLARLRNLTFNEKLTIGIIVIFGPVYYLSVFMLDQKTIAGAEAVGHSFFWLAVWLVITVIAFVVAICTLFFKPNYHPSRSRMYIGRFIPFVVLITILGINIAISSAVSDEKKHDFIKQHEAQLSGKAPKSVIYSEGIPDGGYAIIRSPDFNPDGYSQSLMVELTGERIKSCKKMNERDWYCHYD